MAEIRKNLFEFQLPKTLYLKYKDNISCDEIRKTYFESQQNTDTCVYACYYYACEDKRYTS